MSVKRATKERASSAAQWVDEKTALVVQRIFRQYDNGAGYKQIAITLNDDGHRTEQGQRFRVYHIARILRNKAYIGILEYNIRQDRGPRQPIVITGFYPWIVDEDLFKRVQEKLKAAQSAWKNAYAHRTEYLLSRLVVCDKCGHHYVETAAKGSRFHYYTCQTYLKRGKAACNASLLNKDRLEADVLNQVQQQTLTADNVRRYIEMAVEQAKAPQEPSAEERAVSLAITDIEARLRKWEEALERGLLSLEDAAHRITELRQERASLLNTKATLERTSHSVFKVLPIPTSLMDAYVKEMQKRFASKKDR